MRFGCFTLPRMRRSEFYAALSVIVIYGLLVIDQWLTN
ncbi:hypothetical protein SAMN05444166_4187 [Singulisphaera sp. GP187]|nr:hypothetical protein SAMN05444166_4187 [Singulisphaera sp. GP187]